MIAYRQLFLLALTILVSPALAGSPPASTVTWWHICFTDPDPQTAGTTCELFDLQAATAWSPDTTDTDTLVEQVTIWTEEAVTDRVRMILSQHLEILAHVVGTLYLDFDRQTAWVTVAEVIPSSDEPIFVVLKVITKR